MAVALSPLGADAVAVADYEHPDHQLWIDQGPPGGAVMARVVAGKLQWKWSP